MSEPNLFSGDDAEPEEETPEDARFAWVPKRVGPVAIRERLGNGNFGVVCRGEDPIHGNVAVKLFGRHDKKHDADNLVAWERRKKELLEEGRRLKDATHRNVIPVYHLCDGGDCVALVMELCGGGSVAGLNDSGPLPLPLVYRILTEVSMGLSVLHERGMVHRDIKPSNILCGSGGRYLLGDFGLVTADLVGGYAGLGGYRFHLPPECFDLDMELIYTTGLSVKTDVWALGMTAYRMVSGNALWSALPKPGIDILPADFASNLVWLPHIPMELRRLIGRCLKTVPAQRYQTIKDFLNDLSGIPRPDWECKVSDLEIKWKTTKGKRRVEVILHQAKGNDCWWSAVSHPADGLGRQQVLAGGQKLTIRKAYRELDTYFKDFKPGR